MTQQITNTQYQKIAGMMAVGVPDIQIAAAVGLSAGRISQLKDEPEFQEYLAAAAAQRAETASSLNNSWDQVEQKAIDIVSQHLKHNRNPDFALRAAAVANRATRRGAGNEPLNARTGDVVVINLTQKVVNVLTQVGLPQEKAVSSPVLDNQSSVAKKPLKLVDMINPRKLDSLLVPQQTETDAILASITHEEVSGNV